MINKESKVNLINFHLFANRLRKCLANIIKQVRSYSRECLMKLIKSKRSIRMNRRKELIFDYKFDFT